MARNTPPEAREARRATSASKRDVRREPTHPFATVDGDPTEGTPPRSAAADETRERVSASERLSDETKEDLSLASSVVGLAGGLTSLL